MQYYVIVLGPAKNFLADLELKLRAKSYRTIKLLEEFGPSLTLPHSRKIIGTDSLYELRIQQSTNICRLFYFYHKEKIYVVLSGFVKKKDKTDKAEIDKALNIMKLYLEEENGKN